MPERLAQRVDEIDVTVRGLRGELHRLERLGLESPLARCHQRLRFWQFLAGLHALPPLERQVHRPELGS